MIRVLGIIEGVGFMGWLGRVEQVLKTVQLEDGSVDKEGKFGGFVVWIREV